MGASFASLPRLKSDSPAKFTAMVAQFALVEPSGGGGVLLGSKVDVAEDSGLTKKSAGTR